MNGTGGLKPGVQSTEFYGMLVSQAFAVFVMLKWIPPGDAHSLEDALKQIIVATVTIVGNIGLCYKYVHDRGGLKKMILNQNGGSENSNVATPTGTFGVGK